MKIILWGAFCLRHLNKIAKTFDGKTLKMKVASPI